MGSFRNFYLGNDSGPAGEMMSQLAWEHLSVIPAEPDEVAELDEVAEPTDVLASQLRLLLLTQISRRKCIDNNFQAQQS